MESFQTVGVCILVFIVLPKVDMIRAIFLMNATCIVPAFCKIAFGRPPSFGLSKVDLIRFMFAMECASKLLECGSSSFDVETINNEFRI